MKNKNISGNDHTQVSPVTSKEYENVKLKEFVVTTWILSLISPCCTCV